MFTAARAPTPDEQQPSASEKKNTAGMRGEKHRQNLTGWRVQGKSKGAMHHINIQGKNTPWQTRAEHKPSRGVRTASQPHWNAKTEKEEGTPVLLGLERTTSMEGK